MIATNRRVCSENADGLLFFLFLKWLEGLVRSFWECRWSRRSMQLQHFGASTSQPAFWSIICDDMFTGRAEGELLLVTVAVVERRVNLKYFTK